MGRQLYAEIEVLGISGGGSRSWVTPSPPCSSPPRGAAPEGVTRCHAASSSPSRSLVGFLRSGGLLRSVQVAELLWLAFHWCFEQKKKQWKCGGLSSLSDQRWRQAWCAGSRHHSRPDGLWPLPPPSQWCKTQDPRRPVRRFALCPTPHLNGLKFTWVP